MQYTTFGRTGLRVSVAGLGSGGSSKLGLAKGNSEAEAIRLVRRALDLGVTLIDTARGYGTEGVIGQAIKGRSRESIVIVTKAQTSVKDGSIAPLSTIVQQLNTSLRTLGVDYVDVFMFHGAMPDHLDRLAGYAESLEREREKGKFRFLGCSPTQSPAVGLTALADNMTRAARHTAWDVVMVAMHMLNQQPRQQMLSYTRQNGMGTLMTYAVRSIFSQPGQLHAALQHEVEAGRLPAFLSGHPDPLGFLITEGGAKSIIDAAYRFIRHEPGADVTVFGTSSIDHLEENIASILSPPLTDASLRRLSQEFGHLVGVGMTSHDYTRHAQTGSAA